MQLLSKWRGLAVSAAFLLCAAATMLPSWGTENDKSGYADCVRNAEGICLQDDACSDVGGLCYDVQAGEELPNNAACADPNGDECWCCVLIND